MARETSSEQAITVLWVGGHPPRPLGLRERETESKRTNKTQSKFHISKTRFNSHDEDAFGICVGKNRLECSLDLQVHQHVQQSLS